MLKKSKSSCIDNHELNENIRLMHEDIRASENDRLLHEQYRSKYDDDRERQLFKETN